MYRQLGSRLQEVMFQAIGYLFIAILIGLSCLVDIFCGTDLLNFRDNEKKLRIE